MFNSRRIKELEKQVKHLEIRFNRLRVMVEGKETNFDRRKSAHSQVRKTKVNKSKGVK